MKRMLATRTTMTTLAIAISAVLVLTADAPPDARESAIVVWLGSAVDVGEVCEGRVSTDDAVDVARQSLALPPLHPIPTAHAAEQAWVCECASV
jgi:hypothetical protein